MKSFSNIYKILVLSASILTIPLIANASHCNGEFTGSDLSAMITLDGSPQLLSGSCMGDCYDYFDISLLAGEQFTMSACTGGAMVPDPDFDVYFSVWGNAPVFDTQWGCTDSNDPGLFELEINACGGDPDDMGDHVLTGFTFIAPADGTYRVEISDWDAGFDDGSYTFAYSGGSAPVEIVPTMGEWGIIVLSLMILIMCSVSIMNRKIVEPIYLD